jgi:hypothetical protein
MVIAHKSSALLIKNQMTLYFLIFLFLMTMTVHKIRDCISSACFFSSEICSAHVFFQFLLIYLFHLYGTDAQTQSTAESSPNFQIDTSTDTQTNSGPDSLTYAQTISGADSCPELMPEPTPKPTPQPIKMMTTMMKMMTTAMTTAKKLMPLQ